MAVRIPFTTGFDYCIIILRVITSFAWIFLVFGSLVEAVVFFNPPFPNSKVLLAIICIAAFVGSLLLAQYLHSKTTGKFLFTLSAFLYIRITLKTKISWANCSKVGWLFTPNDTGKWYPLTEVKQMPPEMREIYILNFATKEAIATTQQTLV